MSELENELAAIVTKRAECLDDPVREEFARALHQPGLQAAHRARAVAAMELGSIRTR
jgi:hypothetical protein